MKNKIKSKTLKQLDEKVGDFFESNKHKELKQIMGYTAIFSAAALMGRSLRW